MCNEIIHVQFPQRNRFYSQLQSKKIGLKSEKIVAVNTKRHLANNLKLFSMSSRAKLSDSYHSSFAYKAEMNKIHRSVALMQKLLLVQWASISNSAHAHIVVEHEARAATA